MTSADDLVPRILLAITAATLVVLLISALLTDRPGAGGRVALDADAGRAPMEPGEADDVAAAGAAPEPLDPGEERAGADPTKPALPDPNAAAAAPLVEPERTAVMWATGGLREGTAERVAALEQVERMTLVRAGLGELVRSTDEAGRVVDQPAEGFVIPLDVLSVDPAGYAALYEGAEAVAALEPGQAILSETSAEVRRIGAGGALELADGERLDVAAVLPDEVVGSAEVLVDHVTGAEIGADRDRFLLLVHDGPVGELEADVVRAIADVEDRPVRVLPTEGQPVVRHGLGVLPQAEVKAGFGEFAYRHRGPDRQIEQDPAWVEANIVKARVPLLGTIRCHRKVVPLVREVMEEMVERGLEHTVDRSGYAGCWNGRLTNRLDAVSRHSWGLGIDLNFPDNLVGTPGSMDPELIDAFARRGFTWGGEWLLTDPTHFELTEVPGG